MERTRDVRHVDRELMHYRLGWLVTIGFVLIAVGMIALYAPYYSSFSLQNLIGSFFLIAEACLSWMLFGRDGKGIVPEFLRGLLYLIFAFLIVVYAAGETRALTLFLAIFFVLEGIQKIFFALRLRPEPDWTWGLISGIISLIIAVAVWVVPSGSPLVSVMVGLDLFYSGLATIMIAHAMRKTLEKRATFCIGDVCFSE